MKERWLYSDYEDCETEKPVFYRKKQLMTWQFYLRVIKKWFTPCDECQEHLEKKWGRWITDLTSLKADEYIASAIRKREYVCDSCLDKMMKLLKNGEVILGNKDYEPLVELQRRWVDVMVKNKNGVWDLVMETVTKKEYYHVKGWKL